MEVGAIRSTLRRVLPLRSRIRRAKICSEVEGRRHACGGAQEAPQEVEEDEETGEDGHHWS